MNTDRRIFALLLFIAIMLTPACAVGEEEDDETIHYEIVIKLVWNEPVNLDLYVEEPGGDVASRYNTFTSGGGELGYIDSSREWHYGDSGDNEAPEIYRARYGLEGEYIIHVFCNPAEADEDDGDDDDDGGDDDDENDEVTAFPTETRHVSAEAFIAVTIHGRHSDDAVYFRFPASGVERVSSDENEGWWYAGSFSFVSDREPRDPRECFIATAAYGSPMAEEVYRLRDFRENILLRSFTGRMITGIYHRLSPKTAAVIQGSRLLKLLTRMHLRPLVEAVGILHGD